MKSKPVQFWKDQISNALRVRKDHEKWWDANLKAYSPPPGDDPDKWSEDINTNRDFTISERKKADLFFQSPELTLQPNPALEGPIVGPDGMPLMGPPNATGQAAPIVAAVALGAHQEIVNEELGVDGVDAADMMDSVVLDILVPSGRGCTKLGYESVTVEVEQENPEFVQAQQVSAEFAAQGIPVDATQGIKPTVKVPVPIYERVFWEHFSPKKLLVPHDFRSTKWDDAPWLGMQFELPLTAANRAKYRLPADFKGSKAGESLYLDDGPADQKAAGDYDCFTGVEIYYKSAIYREDRPHPEHLTQLVIVDGLESAAIEEDCKFQTLDARGGLTPDSLIGNPIHPFSVRKKPDSNYPVSDSTMIRPLVNELNTSREQNIHFRDAMGLKWMYNTDALPAEAVAKMVRAPIGGMIGVPGEAFHGEGAIKELPHGTMARENFAIQDYIDHDIAQTVAIDASGSGVQGTGKQTATAEQRQQMNANARVDKERAVLLRRYIKGATKFSTLVIRYLPVERAAQIVGPQLAQIWDAWRKGLSSPLGWTALPDSALRVDQAVDRSDFREFYSFVANDPFFAKGRGKLAEKLCRKHNVDPTEIVSQPEPPKPEPPKLSFSFKGEDVIGPQAVIVLGIAEQLGIKIDPSWILISQGLLAQQPKDAGAGGDTKHGGKLAPGESLSKHAADKTGGMQGTGAPAAMGAPGGMIQ